MAWSAHSPYVVADARPAVVVVLLHGSSPRRCAVSQHSPGIPAANPEAANELPKPVRVQPRQADPDAAIGDDPEDAQRRHGAVTAGAGPGARRRYPDGCWRWAPTLPWRGHEPPLRCQPLPPGASHTPSAPGPPAPASRPPQALRRSGGRCRRRRSGSAGRPEARRSPALERAGPAADGGGHSPQTRPRDQPTRHSCCLSACPCVARDRQRMGKTGPPFPERSNPRVDPEARVELWRPVGGDGGERSPCDGGPLDIPDRLPELADLSEDELDDLGLAETDPAHGRTDYVARPEPARAQPPPPTAGTYPDARQVAEGAT